ncbi:Na(+)-translocating NADH-quinone reductase subunit B [uncultured Ruminococcus sp.]|uniref:RnfABCDGE type electron transport complex subunit D n=1 Tax=Massiliimalia timonensis TaxID=1987501 RepID=A0A8J6PCZ5_9FIRM|nr:RnfABCDGE type electron transport complex subunit D [Massiliimalia timonensis]MBC8609767.1 RnfABCDGE type electron transport complex subunit D [Massiliimalia timonensis]MBS7176318.1 RnfABCDGE type electron transport complex subunit D [Clostridiales bacterium]SCH26530.1 Na(+)-translocating NADH-quinone reductase subunit B [uncultured Ruminococcus sp.]SCH30901.1 Na(+)-translocating NADH-quinone reductase subunit B [uncultured Clostridium sp.]
MKKTMIISEHCVSVIVALLALLAVPVYFFGPRPAVIAAISVATALLMELVCKRWLFKLPRAERHDYSSVVTALIIAMLMPASVDYYIVIIAVVSGLLVGKYAFGGTGRNIFNPAAIGVAFMSISFPEQVLRFPVPGTWLPLSFHITEESGVLYATSPASVMNVGGTPQISRFSLLLGEYPGAMGATCVIALIAIFIFLCFRKAISYRITGAFLFTVACYACLFARTSTGRMNSVIFEITSGVLLFGIIFMASDPHTSPLTAIGQLLYGVFLGLMTMIFRSAGALDVEFVFVLLLANALTKEFDRLADWLLKKVPALGALMTDSETLHARRARRAGGRRV